MITLTDFHALRRSSLAQVDSDRSRDRAERILLFSYGMDRLSRMSEEEKREQLAALEQEAQADIPDEACDYWMDCRFHTNDEDGLTLSYPACDREKLARLELSANQSETGPPFTAMARLLKPADAGHEVQLALALHQRGLAFTPGMPWEEAKDLLLTRMNAVAWEKPWQGKDKVERLNAWGFAQGLYYTLLFEDNILSVITLIDPELVRANLTASLSGRLHSLQNEPLGNGITGAGHHVTLNACEQNLERARSATLGALESTMEFFYELPLEADIAYSGPALTTFRTPPPIPADERPEWVKKLSSEDSMEYRQILLNTDVEVLPQLTLKAADVQSLLEFRQLRDHLQGRPGNHALITKSRAAMASNAPKLSAKGVESCVHRAIKSQLRLNITSRLTGDESLRDDLKACDDDLHGLRSLLGVKLNINFRSVHWNGVVTVRDLAARCMHLIEHPDHSPREDIPMEAMDRMMAQTQSMLATTFESIHKATLNVSETFERDLEELRSH